MITKHSQVSGFLVVRTPDMNKDLEGRGAFSSQATCLDKICYGGIDRMRWFDIDEELYSNRLPVNIEYTRRKIKEMNADFTGIDLCKDLDMAFAMLEYSNRLTPRNELIVVRSKRLAEIKGEFDFDDSQCTWIGYDIIALGYWSLLHDGLFTSPSTFIGWEKMINNFGLFSSPEYADEYVQAYEDASLKGNVEEIPDRVYGIDVIEIGQLIVQRNK
jgi:hypothetical protein